MMFWVQIFLVLVGAAQAALPDRSVQLEQAVRYLEESQRQETSGTEYFSGEWPSTMMVVRSIPLIGKKGKSAPDSNSFTVSSIHTMLAAIWLRQPTLDRIPGMLDRSMERLQTYRTGNTFNFWPWLDPWPLNGTEASGLKVRRPNNFLFGRARVAAGCNVFDDADDTALALSAMKLHSQVRPGSLALLPDGEGKVGEIFNPYRDRRRPLSHFYNLRHRTVRTGAFLTWLVPEHTWNPKTYLPTIGETYMPFGQNDVDCVVNANILNTLARYGDLATPGVDRACWLLDWAFRHGKQKSCGVYYPSRFNVHYVTAKAFDAGAECVAPALDRAVEEVLATQNEDGSWTSDIAGDDVHTSLYALNALLYAGEFDRHGSRSAIERGMQFVLGAGEDTASGSRFWPEGVFFSGGTIARHKIYWKSRSYTTGLAAEALSLHLDRIAPAGSAGYR